MLICVTGGSGFVGAHSIAEITRRGHRVRVLARDAAGVDRALAPLKVDSGAVEVAVGDVTDRPKVTEAMRGADAVLHAASVYSFDSRRREAIRRTNRRGTDIVLDAARHAGADPIVYVSSVGAMFPSHVPVRADSPVGRPREAYLASKAAAETVARDHQRRGSPVVITYPPALLGPHDPNLGDQTRRLRDALRGLLPMWPGGGFPVGDVRDTAALHAGLLSTPVRGHDRYFGPGRYLTTREYVRTLREVTGRALPTLFLPPRALLPCGLLADVAQRAWPWHIPAEYGAIYACAYSAPVDEDAETFGIGVRPVAETFRDSVRWLRHDGHLSARQAGRP